MFFSDTVLQQNTEILSTETHRQVLLMSSSAAAITACKVRGENRLALGDRLRSRDLFFAVAQQQLVQVEGALHRL
jgi:hypothetical protein